MSMSASIVAEAEVYTLEEYLQNHPRHASALLKTSSLRDEVLRIPTILRTNEYDLQYLERWTSNSRTQWQAHSIVGEPPL